MARRRLADADGTRSAAEAILAMHLGRVDDGLHQRSVGAFVDGDVEPKNREGCEQVLGRLIEPDMPNTVVTRSGGRPCAASITRA